MAHKDSEKRKACSRAASKRYRERNREIIAVKHKAWREANTEYLRSYRKAHRDKNREEILAKKKSHYAANREKISAQRKARYEANREKILAKRKVYHAANRDKRKAYVKVWYPATREKHRQKRKEYAKAYNTINCEKLIAKRKVYYAANREKIAKKHREYRQSNRHMTNECARRRRARVRNCVVHLTEQEKNKLVLLERTRSELQKETGIAYHIDHIIPISQGGLHHPINLRILEGSENQSKNAKLLPEAIALAPEHFRLYSERVSTERAWEFVRQLAAGLGLNKDDLDALISGKPLKRKPTLEDFMA